MKEIESLVDDIGDMLEAGTEVNKDLASKYGKQFSDLLVSRLKPRELSGKGSLRMSNIGKPCERQLWYDVNSNSSSEAVPAALKLKFLYGDIIELLMLFLAEASGHKVEGTQDVQEINGIKGHRDCVIDGMVVDVKSASSQSFKKFADGTLSNNDSFGYITQLLSYLEASQNDSKVTDKNHAAFLAVDKTLGHFCLDVHAREDIDYDAMYQHKKEMVKSEDPPERAFVSIPDGKSGNEKLPVNCSYCAHKWTCWEGLRGFSYSNGPVFLTKTMVTPKVSEFNQDGFIGFN